LVEKIKRPLAYNRSFSKVRYIEKAYPFTDRGMLGQNTSPWILNRHHPATKIGHLCVKR
jgi:hypothetical protein